MEDNAGRVKRLYPFGDEFDLRGFDFPIKINDIEAIERRNGITIGVYSYDEQTGIFPVRCSADAPKGFEKLDNHVDLFLVQDGENTHYTYIINFDRLIFKVTKDKRRKYICRRCLSHFVDPRKYTEHGDACLNMNKTAIKIKMPTKDSNIVKFKNIHKQLKMPYVAYADFEAILEPISETGTTTKNNEHKLCSYGSVCIGPDGKNQQTNQLYIGLLVVKMLHTSLYMICANYNNNAWLNYQK